MKAVVLDAPGPVEALQLRELPDPVPQRGWVLIEVRAAGLNRSELHSRLGMAEGMVFPRVLGLEAAGVVLECPGDEFEVGTPVMAMMGGMGRQFDGGYAELTCVPVSQVIPFASSLRPCIVETSTGDRPSRSFVTRVTSPAASKRSTTLLAPPTVMCRALTRSDTLHDSVDAITRNAVSCVSGTPCLCRTRASTAFHNLVWARTRRENDSCASDATTGSRPTTISGPCRPPRSQRRPRSSPAERCW